MSTANRDQHTDRADGLYFMTNMYGSQKYNLLQAAENTNYKIAVEPCEEWEGNISLYTERRDHSIFWEEFRRLEVEDSIESRARVRLVKLLKSMSFAEKVKLVFGNHEGIR